MVEPGEDVLVLNTGYFGDSFADWYAYIELSRLSDRSQFSYSSLETYGAKVDSLKAKVGGVVPLDQIESVLKLKQYKVITVTHVDTSTGTLNQTSPGLQR